MLTTVEGIYRNGQIELVELPDKAIRQATKELRVLVTFLPAQQVAHTDIDLRSHNIDEVMAAELSARLQPFATAWNSPEMDVYDDYEANATNLLPQ